MRPIQTKKIKAKQEETIKIWFNEYNYFLLTHSFMLLGTIKWSNASEYTSVPKNILICRRTGHPTLRYKLFESVSKSIDSFK